ncbi:MAG: DUF11 domain-containing protein, partial [Dehalococcoidia bacterium]
MIRLFKQLIGDQRGYGTLFLAFIGLMLSSLLVIPFLSNTQTHLRTTQKSASSVTDQCSTAGAIEHAIWRLMYEDPPLVDSLTVDNPSITYEATICEQTVPITITRVFPPDYTEPVAGVNPPKAVKLTKTVTPDTATGGVDTTFTYTISFENIGTDPWKTISVSDLLPLYLSYVPGSSAGISAFDPTVTLNGSQEYLRWDLGAGLKVEPGQTLTQGFQAQGTLYEGSHYNDGYGRFTSGLRCRATGPTAPIGVTGGPEPPPPPPPSGVSMTITKDVTPKT